MKRLLITTSVLFALATAYIASPLITAWSIREAVRHGNSNYLVSAIDWPSVRTSLAPSLRRYALDGTTKVHADAAPPSLWQRMKSYFGGGMVDSAIESYLTPEGLPQLFQMRKAYRSYINAGPDESTLPMFERAGRAWKRVRRAAFTGPATFEFDMVDKHDPKRMYFGTMTLGATGWKLTALRIHVEDDVDANASDRATIAADAKPESDAPSSDFDIAPAAPAVVEQQATHTRSAGRVLRQNFWISAAEAAQPRVALPDRNPLER